MTNPQYLKEQWTIAKRAWDKAWAPSLEKFHALESRKKSMYIIGGAVLVLYFIQVVFLAPIQHKTALLEKEQHDMITKTQENRQSAILILTDVRESAANPRSTESRGFTKELRDLNEALAVYYREAVPPKEMVDVLKALLKQDSSMEFVSMNSLPPVELLTEDPRFAAQAAIENRPKLYKRGVQLVYRAGYPAAYAYLKKLEGYNKKIFWDSFIYTVKEYPRAEVSMTVYTLTQEEGWIGN